MQVLRDGVQVWDSGWRSERDTYVDHGGAPLTSQTDYVWQLSRCATRPARSRLRRRPLRPVSSTRTSGRRTGSSTTTRPIRTSSRQWTASSRGRCGTATIAPPRYYRRSFELTHRSPERGSMRPPTAVPVQRQRSAGRQRRADAGLDRLPRARRLPDVRRDRPLARGRERDRRRRSARAGGPGTSAGTREARPTTTARNRNCSPNSSSITPTARRTVVATDGRWVERAGPIRFADLLMGESYDARLELGGWDRPGTTPATGRPPVTSARTRSTLVAGRDRTGAGDARTSPAIAVTAREPGRYIVDLGQNIAGRVRLQGRAAPSRATAIRLRHGEMLRPTASSTPRTCARRRDRLLRQRRAAPRSLRADLHRPRLPVRRGRRLPGRADRGRRDRPGAALGHAGRGRVRVLRRRASTSC